MVYLSVLFSLVIFLNSLFLPLIAVQGTKVDVHIFRCGEPINDAYFELAWDSGPRRPFTVDMGNATVWGPAADEVTFFGYFGEQQTQDASDGSAEFFIDYCEKEGDWK